MAFGVFSAVVPAFNYYLIVMQSLASCAVANFHLMFLLIFIVPEVMCIVLPLFASAYLHYKINKFILNVYTEMLQIGKKL